MVVCRLAGWKGGPISGLASSNEVGKSATLDGRAAVDLGLATETGRRWGGDGAIQGRAGDLSLSVLRPLRHSGVMPRERTIRIFQKWVDAGRPKQFDFCPGGHMSLEQPVEVEHVRAHRVQSGDGRRKGMAFSVGDGPVDLAETVWDS